MPPIADPRLASGNHNAQGSLYCSGKGRIHAPLAHIRKAGYFSDAPRPANGDHRLAQRRLERIELEPLVDRLDELVAVALFGLLAEPVEERREQLCGRE